MVGKSGIEPVICTCLAQVAFHPVQGGGLFAPLVGISFSPYDLLYLWLIESIFSYDVPPCL